ncbi:hypothetical protein RHSIM_Rhsim12G0146100 [Rhododendron simsii]|uniref:Tetraspanin-8 n=1 Tax=Rhododendron simsii TaxID=118357 RepID=A0A834L6X2_RHOSS|nr:hypothetical protein RHSIM_Rhsim12G0146100 [Rhododendron simsii]
MARVSNGFVGFINILTLLLSLAALGGAFFLYLNHASTACQKTLQEPLLIVGAALFVVSLLGLFGSCCRVNSLLYVYLFFMFLLILGLICSTVFTILVTNKGVGNAVSGRGFKEYRLGDYSNWLQTYAVNDQNWPSIKGCLVETKMCSSESLGVTNSQEAAADFYKRSLSPTQSGCCKPPTYCGFDYKNATLWTVPKTGPAVPDTDCTTWSNNQEALCYDCKSCKAGILANLKKEWRLLAVINTCILVFVILVYSVGCCALRNNTSSNYSRYKGGYA